MPEYTPDPTYGILSDLVIDEQELYYNITPERPYTTSQWLLNGVPVGQYDRDYIYHDVKSSGFLQFTTKLRSTPVYSYSYPEQTVYYVSSGMCFDL